VENRNQPPAPDPRDLIDLKLIVSWLTLFLAFVKKRKWLPICTVVLMTGLAIAALKVLPKTYECEIRVQAKKSEYLSPDQSGGLVADADVVLKRREVIADMVKRTNLVQEWRARRGPLFKLKDDIYGALVGPTSDKDLAMVLGATLENSITVETSGDTLTIKVSWRDPEMAYRLVLAAQQAFLEERYTQEISMLSESMDIFKKHSRELETEIAQHADNAKVLIDKKNQELKEASEKKAQETEEKLRGSAPRVAYRGPATPKAPSAPVADNRAAIAELNTSIAEKHAALDTLTAGSRSAVADLQGKLAQARAIYKEAHPVIADLKQQLMVAQQEPPMATQLRSEIAALEAQRDGLGPVGGDPIASPATAARVAQSFGPRMGQLMSRLEEVEQYDLADSEVGHARSKIGLAMRKWESVQMQIDGARLKLETAQAAFRYRYRVVTPAEIPNKAVKPKPAAVVLGAVFGGLLLGLFLALVLELRRGVIHEAWQVESAIGLPVVACIESLPQQPRLQQ